MSNRPKRPTQAERIAALEAEVVRLLARVAALEARTVCWQVPYVPPYQPPMTIPAPVYPWGEIIVTCGDPPGGGFAIGSGGRAQ